MSSSNQEEKEEKEKPTQSTKSSPEGELEKSVNKIINSLSQNIGPKNQEDHEYEYEEYEIEEYEEEEESIPNSRTTKKETFMTQNISTIPPSPKTIKTNSISNKKLKDDQNQRNIKKTNQRRKSPPKHITSADDQSDAESKLELLIRDGTMPDSDSAQSVLRLINRRKVDALLSSDYESAEVYDKASQNLMMNIGNLSSIESENHECQNRENRQHQLLKKLHETEDRYTQQMQLNINECERRLDEAEQRHFNEVEEFKKNWKNPEYIKQFSKPSSTMLQLRYVEKKLALAKRYNDAVRQRNIGDRQQLIETENLQKNIEKQMKSDFAKMREKQKSEIEKIEEHYDRLNGEIEAKLKRETDAINFALKRNVDSQKPKNVNNRKFVGRSSGGLESALPSPRTKKKFNQYKNDRNAQIILTPFDDATLSKLPVSSLRSDRHKLKPINSRSSTTLSTARSAAFSSSRSKSSIQKNRTEKSFSVSLNSHSNFPNLNA